MPKLIKNKQLANNDWTILKTNEAGVLENFSHMLDKKIFVPLAFWASDLWLTLPDSLTAKLHANELGIFIDSHQNCDELPENFKTLPAIAINFPMFTDGRGYSIAKDLRTLKKYTGEIRAVGEVLHDQLNAMMRCGFDAFELVDDKDADKALLAFNDFSQKYQADLVDKRPIYLR